MSYHVPGFHPWADLKRGTTEWWNGATEERWNDGTANGVTEERWNGGTEERWNDGKLLHTLKDGMAENCPEIVLNPKRRNKIIIKTKNI